ncbi:MAG: hypothetical protein QM767_23620 [Anaeromyxobacter sp.]
MPKLGALLVAASLTTACATATAKPATAAAPAPAAAPAADATSQFKRMNVRGTMNDWGITPMKLVAKDTWECQIDLDASTPYQFKFDTGNWNPQQNWGLAGDKLKADAANIPFTTGGKSGKYTFTFNDQTLVYSIKAP